MEDGQYTLDELVEKYPPRKISVKTLEASEEPVLGPFDFLDVNSWEDLSKIGADLNNTERHNCEDEINNWLDIVFVGCRYDNKYDEDENTELLRSTVAIFPHAMVDASYEDVRNKLADILEKRGYYDLGDKTAIKVEDDEEAE